MAEYSSSSSSSPSDSEADDGDIFAPVVFNKPATTMTDTTAAAAAAPKHKVKKPRNPDAPPAKESCIWEPKGGVAPYPIAGTDKKVVEYVAWTLTLLDGTTKRLAQNDIVNGVPGADNQFWRIERLVKDPIAKGALFRLRRMIALGNAVNTEDTDCTVLAATNLYAIVDRVIIKALRLAPLNTYEQPTSPIYAAAVDVDGKDIDAETLGINKKITDAAANMRFAIVPGPVATEDYLRKHRFLKPPICCRFRFEHGYVASKSAQTRKLKESDSSALLPPGKKKKTTDDKVLDPVVAVAPAVAPVATPKKAVPLPLPLPPPSPAAAAPVKSDGNRHHNRSKWNLKTRDDMQRWEKQSGVSMISFITDILEHIAK